MKSAIVAACALSVSLVLAGCGATSTGSGGSSPAPSSSSASPTSASPRTTTGTSTTAEPAPAITTIPDDELPQMEGFDYVSDGIDDAALLEQMNGASNDDPRMEGAVVRGISSEGQVGGVISMFRAERDFTATEARNSAIDAAAGFAMLKRADRKTVSGETVWQTTREGSPALIAMAWTHDDSVYLLATASAKDTKTVMAALIAAVSG